MVLALAAPTHPRSDVSAAAEVDLLATTIHQLRSPLTSISGQVQLARRFVAKDSAREREALTLALVQVARMVRLLDELRDLSRLAPDEQPCEQVRFGLRDVAALAIARHETGDARIRANLCDASVEVRGDAEKVGRIVDNLLDNALTYSPLDAPVDVSLDVIGAVAHLRVTDHGLGIPADAQDQLFSPYFRSARTRHIPGTGLGLHISWRVAQQHGGHLWLEDSTDNGSTFALVLPLAT